MTDTVKSIPEGYHSLTPYLIIKGAAEAIEFYKTAFGAEEVVRMPMPDGRIGHAELRIGNSMLMLAEEMEEMGHRSAQTLNGCPVGFVIYLEDVDKEFQRAVDAGQRAQARAQVEQAEAFDRRPANQHQAEDTQRDELPAQPGPAGGDSGH